MPPEQSNHHMITQRMLNFNPKLDLNLHRELQKFRNNKENLSLTATNQASEPKSYKSALKIPYWKGGNGGRNEGFLNKTTHGI